MENAECRNFEKPRSWIKFSQPLNTHLQGGHRCVEPFCCRQVERLCASREVKKKKWNFGRVFFFFKVYRTTNIWTPTVLNYSIFKIARNVNKSHKSKLCFISYSIMRLMTRGNYIIKALVKI